MRSYELLHASGDFGLKMTGTKCETPGDLAFAGLAQENIFR